MKFLLISAFICVILASLWTVDAYPNKKPMDRALRQKLLDYFMEARREMLFGDDDHLNDEDDLRHSSLGLKSDNDDDARRTFARRKAVGLGDNPFK